MADYLEGLEYHLNFPPSISKEIAKNIEKDDFEFVYDSSKLPVVILFGWAGCRDKDLAKYSSFYEEKGCITLRFIIPSVVTFFKHDELPRITQKILDLVHEMSLDEHPIFFHIFSNGGAFFYQHVSLQMQKDERLLQVKGAIFDSAPGERRLFPIFRTMICIIGGPIWSNCSGSFIATVVIFLGLMALIYIKGWIDGYKPNFDPTMLEEEPFRWPQLFIYSRNDGLVFYEKIERFASKRQKKGVVVQKLCFERSHHVGHLVHHREKYIETAINFIQDCISGDIFDN